MEKLYLVSTTPILQKKFSIESLRCGILIFILLTVVLLCRGGAFILLVIYAVPGVGYGIVLGGHTQKQYSNLAGIAFVILSLAINILCVSQVAIDFLESRPIAAFKLITYGAIGAVLLSLCYDLLLLRRFSLYYTIAMPAILGIAASLFSAGCMQLLLMEKNNGEVVGTLLFLGVFSFFPLWQYLFGWNIDRHNRTIATA